MTSAVPGEVPTRSRGLWLVVARMAWIALALVTVGLFTAAIPARYEQLRVVSPHAAATVGQLTPAAAAALVPLGLSSTVYAAYFIALESIVAIAYVVVAAVIAWWRTDDWIALFVSLMLLTLAPVGQPTIAVLAEQHPFWEALIIGLRALAAGFMVIFCFVFPDGHFVPSQMRLLAIIWSLCTLGGLLVPALRLPVGLVSLSTLTDIFRTGWFIVWLIIGASAQAYRYRRVSNVIQRQQTKWFVFGLLALILVVLTSTVPPLVVPALSETTTLGMVYRLTGLTLILFGLLLIPTTIGIAILRYRLFDIDVLINRALVYGSLTVTLGLVYWGSVVLLQQLLQWFTGQRNELATIASTLTIVALFHPLRRSIQRRIDRRFYRRKYDAVQVLQGFTATLRDNVDLSHLSDDLLAVVDQTVQPAHVSLWLRDAPTRPQIDSRSGG